MAIVQADDIADVVTAALRELGEGRWTDISFPDQEYIAFSRLMREQNISLGSGRGIQWTVQTTDSGAARNTGLFDVDNVDVVDTLTQGNAPWRYYDTSWAFDGREMDMTTGAREIVSLVETRRNAGMISLARLMEADFWSKPTDSTDNSKPFGVPYWVEYDATEGFNGGNPSGFSAGAGNIDQGTHSRWANWTNNYTNVTTTDLIRKWRKAATFTFFVSPNPEPDFNTGDMMGYFTTYAVRGNLEEVADSRNDSLGPDVAFHDNKVRFRGTPVTWAPYLENKSGDPVYGLNFGVFKSVFLSGWAFRSSRVEPAPNSHNVVNVFEDVVVNHVCYDRRRNFVIATADPA